MEISRKIKDEKEINRTCECMTVRKVMKNVAVVVAEVTLTATI